MKYSIVIPTINEEHRIGKQIRYIRRLKKECEIIVVDGGSSDKTIEIAKKAGVTVICSKQGRGTQLKAGAEASSGDIFVFLHTDTKLPSNAFSILQKFFEIQDNLIATFRINFQPPYFLLKIVSVFVRFDTFLTKFGDQSITIRNSFYKQLGGFPDWPLFEDVYIFNQARKYTKIHTLPGVVQSSSRRFKKNGVLRQLIWNAWLIFLYYNGRSPEKLSRMYKRNLRN